MLSIDQLLIYLNDHHHIQTNKSQSRPLRNVGYYHGYKGYRFVRSPNQPIAFSSFDEVIALNKFDMELKSLFYPKVMFIENALKSYVTEAILENSESEDLDSIFSKAITAYRLYKPGSLKYKNEFSKRIILKERINNTLLRDYQNNRQTVNHFFNYDRPIPIWAVFESLTLGEFGTLFSCASLEIKIATSKILQLPRNLDSDGKLIEFIIYVIRDLRNAIAHNNIIFDTRFKTNKINNRLKQLIAVETKIDELDFKYIGSYVILICYILRKMGEDKEECERFITDYFISSNKLRTAIPPDICNQILGTKNKNNFLKMRQFIKWH